MALKILIADDHKIIRDGLRGLVSRQSDWEIVGESESGRKAVELAKKLRPDIVVMDVALPDLSGIEATRLIKAELPETKVVALSMHADALFVRRMMASGASAYLLKDCAFDELVRAVKTVLQGKTFYGKGLSVADTAGKAAADRPAAPLSDREREVLVHMASGKSTKEIAAALGLSGKTVETHRKHIMDKLDIYTVAGLTKYALREGLADLSD